MSQGPVPPGPPPGQPVNPYAPPSAPMPPSGYGPAPAETAPLPWVERSRLGFVPALVDTIKLIATSPSEAFARIRADGDYVTPLLFGLILSWLGTIVSTIWQLLFGTATSSMFGGMEGAGAMAGGAAVSLVILVVFPILYVIGVLIGAGVYHLGLMIVGGLENSPTRFEGTFKVVNYIQVSALAAVIPILGGFISAVAGIVFLYFGLLRAHQTTPMKAILAIIVPLLLVCLCVFGGMMLAGGVGALAALGG